MVATEARPAPPDTTSPREDTELKPDTYTKPLREVGSFFALSLDIMVQMVRPPWAWREFIHQSWFVARVTIFPTFMVSIPFNAFAVFIIGHTEDPEGKVLDVCCTCSLDGYSVTGTNLRFHALKRVQ